LMSYWHVSWFDVLLACLMSYLLACLMM